jgi:hypothetical protein
LYNQSIGLEICWVDNSTDRLMAIVTPFAGKEKAKYTEIGGRVLRKLG